MSRETDLIIDPARDEDLCCPSCKSTNWERDGSSLTFILKTYRCITCGTHWLMFSKELTKKATELNK